MTRAPFILLLVLALSAIGLVTATHNARRLIAHLEQERVRAHQLDVELGELQLEQKRLGNLAQVQRIASERLQMLPPAPRRTQVVEVPGGANGPESALATAPMLLPRAGRERPR